MSYELFQAEVAQVIGGQFRFSDHSEWRENGRHRPYYQAEGLGGSVWVQYYWAEGVFVVQAGAGQAYGEELRDVYASALERDAIAA